MIATKMNLPAFSVKMGSFAIFAHKFLSFFRRSRAKFWGLAGNFWSAGHRLWTTDLDQSIRDPFNPWVHLFASPFNQ